jgi:membrane-associated HD superfamily phosphohydrolase
VLTQIILNSFSDVKTITLKYWWAFLLGTIVFVIFIAVLVMFVNKRAPSSIPKRTRTMEMSLLHSNGNGSGR